MTTHTQSQRKKVLYTARVHTAGNRDGGVSRSDDGRLAINMTSSITRRGRG